jgi:hypoxanthine phosphoribosyltransferase
MAKLFINEEEFSKTVNVPKEGITDIFFDADTDDNILIPTSCIKKRISGLTDEITTKNDSTKSLDILIVLSGSFMFAADLSKELYEKHKVNIRTHFMKLSYYGDSIKSSKEKREIKVEMTPSNMETDNLIIVEDIIDQGFTLQWMLEYLQLVQCIKNIQICTLLNKKLDNPTKEIKEIRSKIKIDYLGFVIPDIWVAGYGMDIQNEYRNTPFVFKA